MEQLTSDGHRTPRIGVLALQGDYEAHRKILERCGAEVVEVRDTVGLDNLEGLVIPGGESTVMSRLCDRYELWEPLREHLAAGMGALGTCAGMILLAKSITGASRNFEQRTLGALDIDVARNAYGAQIESFEADIDFPGSDGPLRAVFIRAPRIVRHGDGVEVVAAYHDEPVVVSDGKLMATSFHPEISGDTRVHALWLDRVRPGRQKGGT